MSGELNGGLIQFQIVLRLPISITPPAVAGENTRIETEMLLHEMKVKGVAGLN